MPGGFRVEIEAYGDKLISRELVDLSARGRDVRPAFRTVADGLMRAERRRFATRGNGTWRDTTAATKRRKAHSRNPTVRANASRVLRATDRLMRSLTVKGDPDQVLIIEPHFMMFGTRDPKAKYHQKGTSRMPARKPLGFTETSKRQTVRTLQKFLRTGEV